MALLPRVIPTERSERRNLLKLLIATPPDRRQSQFIIRHSEFCILNSVFHFLTPHPKHVLSGAEWARFPSPVLVIPSAAIVIPSAAIVIPSAAIVIPSAAPVIPSAAIVIPSAAEESIEPPAPQHPANLRFTIQNSMFVIRYSSFSPPRPISPTCPTRPACPICPTLFYITLNSPKS